MALVFKRSILSRKWLAKIGESWRFVAFRDKQCSRPTCHLGRKTRSEFFTPILARAFFTLVLHNFYAFFYLPAVRVFYSDPPPRFYRVFYPRFFKRRFTRFYAFFSFLDSHRAAQALLGSD